ncbi:MAG: 2-succinyl-6-hydroxy-2,4-cyclohexadiene-1-carboxylate synthase [Rhodocyclaceae bacterium]|jgi:pimeloyl-ACP methyl ester carboxylesterase|nr:2-succinyl-6-hydroxy-2,4-cyclohexadiene-1-carboxylate synthase [Rhodocyclaceae bacterium]
MKSSTSEFLTIRGLKSHVRLWGPTGAPKLFLLHGWMDCSASFQFLVDAFARDWRVIAPDWRGFGLSEWLNGPYWFPDYLADLERLLDHYAPDEPVRLAGHSMGGNVAGLYAGARPARVAKLAILEGFGLHSTEPAQAPGRYAKWLDQDKAGATLRDYADLDEFATRLMRDNPRLTQAQAEFLAANFSQRRPDGRFGYAADPWHRVINPVLYRFEEAKACWRAVTAPVLWVVARDSHLYKEFAGRSEDYAARLASFARLREVVLDDCGHMLQHDQPQRLAQVVEQFLG